MRSIYRGTILSLALAMLMSIPAGIVSGGFEENASEAVSADPDLSAGSGVFVQNDGQYDPEILFVTSTDAGNIALCRDGIRQLVVVREQVEPERWYEKPRSVVKDHSLVSFEFVGGSPESVVGDDRVPTVYNFFLGKDPSHWATGVSGFQRITYRDVWDGIDIVYYQRNGHLKYDLILSPGADPDSIRMSVEGADSVRVVGGSLSISTHVGVEISDSGLCARYSDGGAVKVAFELDGTEYGFDLGGYDASRTVVIDPEYNANAMNFSTFIGGSGWEYPNKIDLDSKGDIYITGSTDSYDFPTSKGAYQKSLNGWENAFVFKLNRAGNSMLYATYIGGSYSDQGYDIEVDGSGNAYVVGVTYSEDFPVTMGAYNDTLNNASDDLFFLELDWIGGSLSYSTYFGGSDSEMMPSLEIDTSGTMYVASATMSRDFPITSDAYQDSFVSPLGMWLSDATLVKFDLASMKLVYSTFMGGTDDDITTSILYDGYVYICGGTRSTDFNISSRPYQMKNAGDYDAFLMKFDLKSNSIVYSTYFGGSSVDAMTDFSLDSSGNSYCCGVTYSRDLTCSSGADDKTLNGDNDGMLFGFDSKASSLLFSSFVGGDGEDQLFALDLGSDMNIHAVGFEDDWMYEDGLQFEPTEGAMQEIAGGGYEEGIYVMAKSDASSILYSTFLGGNDDDECMDVRVDQGDGQPIVMGLTSSTDFPVKIGSYSTSNSGGNDVFVTKFDSSARIPGGPIDLMAVSGDSFIELTWSPPVDDGGSNVFMYSIYRGIESGNLDQKLADLGVYIYNDTAVENGRTYYYAIRAINKIGEGPFSDEVEARPAAIPSAPRNLKVSSLADKSVELTWTPPEYYGGIGIYIEGYTLYRTVLGSVEPTPIDVDGPLTHYTDEAVENGVNYSYYITAFNEIGESPPSGIVYAIPMKVPTEPLDLQVERGDGFVHLFWSVPANDGGSPIQNYTIVRTEKSTKVITIGPETDYNDTTVENGLVYKYTVKARNIAGYGPVSDDISAKPLGRPSEVRSFVVTAAPSSVSLSWDRPDKDGGAAIENYVVYRGTTATELVAIKTIPGTETTYTDGMLTNGRTYYYYITALNAEGESAPCGVLSATPLDYPGPPLDVSIFPGDGFIVISWSSPLSDGGSAILGFGVFRGEYESSMEPIALVAADQLSYNDTTAKNGKTYFYQVKAFSAIGNGTVSYSVTGMAAGLPSAPGSITVTAGDKSVDITWSKPASDGGLQISGIRIYRWTVSSAEEMILETTNVQGTFKDNAVQNGVTYSYALTASNELGEGKRSETFDAMPLGKPSAVKGVIVKALSDSSAEVTWSAPDSNGGSPILHYYIYRSAGAGSWIKVGEVGPEVTKYIDKDLSAGKMYRYKISAVNAQGEGPQTAEQTVEIKEASGGSIGLIIAIALLVLFLIIAGVATAFVLSRKKKEEIPISPMGMPQQIPDQYQMAQAPVNVGIMPPTMQSSLPAAGYQTQPGQMYTPPASLPPTQAPPPMSQAPVSYPPMSYPQADAQVIQPPTNPFPEAPPAIQDPAPSPVQPVNEPIQ